MENTNVDSMKRQIAILEKKLERSQNSRKLIEQAKDHYDLVYRSSIHKLNIQKELLNIKNEELELARIKLLAANNELEQIAITDDLTGIYNRKKIIDIFNEEYFKAQYYGMKISVITIDVDWFKLVNDTYGHQVGDRVLFEVAKLMKDSIHSTDYIGRWGGEEFFIVLPNASENEGYMLAEKIRLKISCYDFQTARQLTCSFGITEYMEDDCIEQIIKRADTALYQAKVHRNCSRVFK